MMEVGAMKRKRISIKGLIMWEFITLTLFGLIISIPWNLFEHYSLLWWSTVGSIGLLSILTCIGYLPIYFLSAYYVIDDNMVLYTKGIFSRRTHVLRREQITIVSVVKNPFTPIFRTCSVVIKAPGATITIKHLNVKVAAQVLRILSPNTRLLAEDPS